MEQMLMRSRVNTVYFLRGITSRYVPLYMFARFSSNDILSILLLTTLSDIKDHSIMLLYLLGSSINRRVIHL